jgi:hypothetical protein
MSETISTEQELQLPAVQEGQREVATLDDRTDEFATDQVPATSANKHFKDEAAVQKRLEEQRQAVQQESLGNVEDHWSVGSH